MDQIGRITPTGPGQVRSGQIGTAQESSALNRPSTQVVSLGQLEDTNESINASRINRANFRSLSERRPVERGRRPSESSSVEGSYRVEEVGDEEGQDLADQFQREDADLSAQLLRNLAEELRDAIRTDPNLPFEEILRRVQSRVPDPTLADRALDYLEQVIEGNAKRVVADARHYLQSSQGAAVRVGYNIKEAIDLYPPKGVEASPTELRNLYRGIVFDPPKDHNALFTELSNKYPFPKLRGVISFLWKSMKYDLQSKGSSIQPEELVRIMSEIRKLQSILGVYRHFKSRTSLIKLLYNEIGSTNQPPSFETLSKTFIELVDERYPTVEKILAKLEKLGIVDDEEKIILLNQFRDAIREVSPKIYRDAQHSQHLLEVIIAATNQLEEQFE